MIMSFKEFLKHHLSRDTLPELDEVFVTKDGVNLVILREGKQFKGTFDNSIRVDNPTHGVGLRHAHVFGRKGNQIVAVNIDGSASHGTKGRIPEKDADKLRSLGFTIPTDRIVEWTVVEEPPHVLLG